MYSARYPSSNSHRLHRVGSLLHNCGDDDAITLGPLDRGSIPILSLPQVTESVDVLQTSQRVKTLLNIYIIEQPRSFFDTELEECRGFVVPI
jgi:hypothetical protein